MRRLTRVEYNNTVRTLLGTPLSPASKWLPDEKQGGFDTNVSLGVTSVHAAQFVDAAEAVAAEVSTRLIDVLPCDLSNYGTDECADLFLADFLPRAFRRPVDAAETKRFRGLYEWAQLQQEVKTEDRFADGIRLVIEAALQAPSFLYRVEQDATPSDEVPGLLRVGDFEMASRLSYFLWKDAPDPELNAEAAAGRLHTLEQIEAQARRMLKSPKARAGLDEFHRQWLDLDLVLAAERDEKLYPGFTSEVGQALVDGTLEWTAGLVQEGSSGTLGALFTRPTAYVNKHSAPLFNLKSSSTELERVDLDPSQRAGILTQPALMTALAKYNQSHPILRGIFTRTKVMCLTLPSAPDNVEIKTPELDPNLTTRERFEQHRLDPSCAGCHRLIDGTGMTFENYDAIGRYRDKENGLPIDPSGELVETEELDGPLTDALDLSKQLASSELAANCFTTQWVRYAIGREREDEDACGIERTLERFENNGLSLTELIVAVAVSDAMRFRRPQPQASSQECSQ